jgi:hypothetical protein
MQLQIGETLYKLEYKINSMIAVEKQTGESFGNVFKMPDLTGIQTLLWCGLMAHHKMTLNQVGDLIEAYFAEHGYIAGKEKLNLALAEAMSEAVFLTAQGTEN